MGGASWWRWRWKWRRPIWRAGLVEVGIGAHCRGPASKSSRGGWISAASSLSTTSRNVRRCDHRLLVSMLLHQQGNADVENARLHRGGAPSWHSIYAQPGRARPFPGKRGKPEETTCEKIQGSLLRLTHQTTRPKPHLRMYNAQRPYASLASPKFAPYSTPLVVRSTAAKTWLLNMSTQLCTWAHQKFAYYA